MIVNGAALVPDPSGALWWPGEKLLAAADLHLEKGSAFAARGQFLPPYDTAATLARLAQVIARLKPERVILLGDTFHDPRAMARIARGDVERLAALVACVPHWTWIAGNHDPAPPAGLGGQTASVAALGPLVFRHEPEAPPQPGEVAGHLHPAARLVHRGRSIRRRCFVTDGTRLLMPAFGAYAGGLDTADPAIASLFGKRFHAWMLGDGAVHAVPAKRLAAQNLR